jgi:hypothetical protein
VLSSEFERLFDRITKEGEVDLKDREISKSILVRLKYYYDYQDVLKSLLNKRYAPSAADCFVETVVFYLRAVFKIYDVPLEVWSERQVEKKRGSMRPDISIWRNDTEVVGIIECKTQVGWNRDNWEKDFSERENELRETFPEAVAFLVVLTSANWAGFRTDKNVGKKYFCLLDDVWPTQLNLDRLDVLNPIEPMIAYFVTNYRGQ